MDSFYEPRSMAVFLEFFVSSRFSLASILVYFLICIPILYEIQCFQQCRGLVIFKSSLSLYKFAEPSFCQFWSSSLLLLEIHHRLRRLLHVDNQLDDFKNLEQLVRHSIIHPLFLIAKSLSRALNYPIFLVLMSSEENSSKYAINEASASQINKWIN